MAISDFPICKELLPGQPEDYLCECDFCTTIGKSTYISLQQFSKDQLIAGLTKGLFEYHKDLIKAEKSARLALKGCSDLLEMITAMKQAFDESDRPVPPQVIEILMGVAEVGNNVMRACKALDDLEDDGKLLGSFSMYQAIASHDSEDGIEKLGEEEYLRGMQEVSGMIDIYDSATRKLAHSFNVITE